MRKDYVIKQSEDERRAHHRANSAERRERGSGAQTFRRKRIVQFLIQLETRKASLQKQLETPELQNLHPVLLGELKAVQTTIDEYIQLFELYEYEDGSFEQALEEKSE